MSVSCTMGTSVQRGVSKGVENSHRLPARAIPEMALIPFKGWPAHRAWKGRAWRAQVKL
jgi:hypothetical protein